MASISGKSSFFGEIMEGGYHIFSFSRTNAKTPGYYPNQFPDYPGVRLCSLSESDRVTIQTFFRVDSRKDMKIDSGHIDLEIKLIEPEHIFGVILTELPKQFPLETGRYLEIWGDEILYKVVAQVH